MKIRVIKTATKAQAVQVVRYQNNKRIIMKHIGSARNAVELDELLFLAEEWIKDYSKQLSVFPDENPNKLLHLNYCTFVGVQYRYFYEQIRFIQSKLELDSLPSLLNDLVCMRIFQPAAKKQPLN